MYSAWFNDLVLLITNITHNLCCRNVFIYQGVVYISVATYMFNSHMIFKRGWPDKLYQKLPSIYSDSFEFLVAHLYSELLNNNNIPSFKQYHCQTVPTIYKGWKV